MSVKWYHSKKGFSRKQINGKYVVLNHSTRGRTEGKIWIDASNFGKEFEDEVRVDSWKDALKWVKQNLENRVNIVGFTGTRSGMTVIQIEQTSAILTELKSIGKIDFGLHGDCVGADADFDKICKRLQIQTCIRPGNMPVYRARCLSKELDKPRPPLIRNKAIVQDADIMLACPANKEELKRGSGTWATIRLARKENRALTIIFPDGEICRERQNF